MALNIEGHQHQEKNNFQTQYFKQPWQLRVRNFFLFTAGCQRVEPLFVEGIKVRLGKASLFDYFFIVCGFLDFETIKKNLFREVLFLKYTEILKVSENA